MHPLSLPTYHILPMRYSRSRYRCQPSKYIGSLILYMAWRYDMPYLCIFIASRIPVVHLGMTPDETAA